LWQKYSQQLYEKYEPLILTTIERHQVILSLIRSVSPVVGDSRVIESKEELLEMVAQSTGAISSSEKKLITNGLKFNDMKVEEIMTPRSMIESVPMNELLGPLVLDDLHKKGYSRFPVIDGDIDHVVGMLRIQDLLTIDRKAKSHRAETVMSKDVYYIRENQTLQHALAAFLKTQHHLFIVVNEFRETVGLLSLEDVIEALLGQKIIDEYDIYGDIRKAATANPQKNNLPTKTRRDV
jgi:CBS domain protein